jgi:hypothetical protein
VVLYSYGALGSLLNVTAGASHTQRVTHMHYKDFPQKLKNNGVDLISVNDTG